MTDPALIEMAASSRRSNVDPSSRASAIDLDTARALINRVSWIALMLTPLTGEGADQVAAAVADLDGLVGDLRLAAVGADDIVDDPVEHARQVLHDVRARLGRAWAAGLDCRSDPVHADRLTDACHLVQAALISLQRGAVP